MKCASWQFLLLLVFTGVVRTEKPVIYHTEEINGQIEVVQGGEGLFPATATYSDDVATTGWATLSIEGNDEFPEVLQAFSAGYLEGHLTQHRIFEAQSNMFAHAFGAAGPGPNVTRFFEEQLAFVRHLIVTEHDAYATSLALVMSQFEGLYRGYVSAAPANESLTELELYMHNAAGDLEDLATVLGEAHQPLTLASRNNGLSAVDFLDCSALLVLGKDDAFAGHTTWRDYGNMSPRTYKWVRLSGRTVGYSSTPGFLSSKDDFYTVTSPRHNVSLSVIETTNAIFNTSLYDRLTPRSVFTWQRTMIANKIATNGDEWTEAFGHLNSGTYNNQWMVLDYNKLGERTESGAAPTGSLWILEQIPGYVQRGDVTAVLNKQKYWASYNIPFFVDVYNMSGYNTQPGTDNSYQHCPRANIFRQRAANVTDVAALQFIMQYNDYEHDPLSSHNPMNAISSRADLLSQPLAEPKAFGGIDSKVTSGRLIADDRAMATSGPTQQQKPFVWSHTRFKTMHQGQPDAFDFPWRAVSPTWQESME